MSDSILDAWNAAMRERPLTFDRAQEIAESEVATQLPGVDPNNWQFRGRVMRRVRQLVKFDPRRADLTGRSERLAAARKRLSGTAA